MYFNRLIFIHYISVRDSLLFLWNSCEANDVRKDYDEPKSADHCKVADSCSLRYTQIDCGVRTPEQTTHGRASIAEVSDRLIPLFCRKSFGEIIESTESSGSSWFARTKIVWALPEINETTNETKPVGCSIVDETHRSVKGHRPMATNDKTDANSTWQSSCRARTRTKIYSDAYLLRVQTSKYDGKELRRITRAAWGWVTFDAGWQPPAVYITLLPTGWRVTRWFLVRGRHGQTFTSPAEQTSRREWRMEPASFRYCHWRRFGLSRITDITDTTSNDQPTNLRLFSGL